MMHPLLTVHQELGSWSQLYKTSWFRIAVSIISLVTAGTSSSSSHRDQSLMVAFGARPKGYENCIGHFANTVCRPTRTLSVLSAYCVLIAPKQIASYFDPE